MHSERPQEALQHHQQALAIYEQAGDKSGVAATSDLLGITGASGGDVALLLGSCRRAIALFRELGNLRDLATNLASYSLRAYCSFSAVLVEDRIAVRATFGDLDEAVALSRQIGWAP